MTIMGLAVIIVAAIYSAYQIFKITMDKKSGASNPTKESFEVGYDGRMLLTQSSLVNYFSNMQSSSNQLSLYVNVGILAVCIMFGVNFLIGLNSVSGGGLFVLLLMMVTMPFRTGGQAGLGIAAKIRRGDYRLVEDRIVAMHWAKGQDLNRSFCVVSTEKFEDANIMIKGPLCEGMEYGDTVYVLIVNDRPLGIFPEKKFELGMDMVISQ